MVGFTRPVLLLGAVILFGGIPVVADEVHEQMDAAREAYDQGDLRGAVESLQFSVAKIQEQITGRLSQLLPEPLPGWRAEEPQSQSAGILTAIAGTSLARRYYNEEDGAEVEISIMTDSPMMGMLNMMFTSPFLLQASPGTSAFTHHGYRGMLEHAQGSDEWQMKLMVGPRTLVLLAGRGLEQKDPLQAYLEALDLAAIEKAMTE